METDLRMATELQQALIAGRLSEFSIGVGGSDGAAFFIIIVTPASQYDGR